MNLTRKKIAVSRAIYAIAVIIIIAAAAGAVYFIATPGNGNESTSTTTSTSVTVFRTVDFESGGATNSWSNMMTSGMIQASEYMNNTTPDTIFKIAHVYTLAASDAQSVMASYANKGYNLLIPGDTPFQLPSYTVASQYPNTNVVGIAMPGSLSSNVGNIAQDIWAGYFPAGVIAGAMTKSNIIGFVTAQSFSTTQYAINAFLAGARMVNPNVKIAYTFDNDWHDPVTAQQATSALIAAGADVITAYGDGLTTGVLSQAAQSHVYAIGDQANQNSISSSYVLTCVMWNMTSYFVNAMQAALVGQVGYKTWALGVTSTYLTPYQGIPQDVLNTVNPIITQIYSGQVPIPENSTLPASLS